MQQAQGPRPSEASLGLWWPPSPGASTPPRLRGAGGQCLGPQHPPHNPPNRMPSFKISISSRHFPRATLLRSYLGLIAVSPPPLAPRVVWQTGLWARIQAGAQVIGDQRLVHPRNVLQLFSDLLAHWILTVPARVGGGSPQSLKLTHGQPCQDPLACTC